MRLPLLRKTLLFALMAAWFGIACANTSHLVDTPQGVYRFYYTGGNPYYTKKVEKCQKAGSASVASCADYPIRYNF